MSKLVGERAFFGVSALTLVASAAVTIAWWRSMSAMAGMPMPGGWTMSMAWMPMPGQTRLDAAASFLVMWVAMMVAMMLPSLVPVLWRYRQEVASAGERHLGTLTVVVGIGYFFIWIVFGMIVFPIGVTLAAIAMQQPTLARAVPVAIGVVVVAAGVLQFTQWKADQLACCRAVSGHRHSRSVSAGAAWRHGVNLGVQCAPCCGNLMLILMVLGVMDLRVMAAVTAAITVERLTPVGERVARAIGAIVVAAGLLGLASVAGLG